MKKFLLMILALAMVLTSVLAIGCNNSSNEEKTTTTTTTKKTTTTRDPGNNDPIGGDDGSDDQNPPVNDDKIPDETMVSFVTPYTDIFDLTAEGTKYWEYYGILDDNAEVQSHQKALGDDIIEVTFNGIQHHDDNKAEITWSDGKDVASATTRHGTNCTRGADIEINVAGCTEIKLLVGVWNATNTLYLSKTIDDDFFDEIEVINAGGEAVMALVTIDLTGYGYDTLCISMLPNFSSGGNISLTGIAIK